MREDMFKVIVERPRSGGGGRVINTNKGFAFEDLPLKESMTKKYGHNRKSLNEHLGPLKRFLITAANAKRKWDDVFSEICENIRLDSTVQRHVREHVEWYVEKNTFMLNGKVHTYESGNGKPILIEGRGWSEFYVHPVTGILIHKGWKKNWWRKDEKKKAITRVEINKHEQLHLINGFWFHLTLADVPEKKKVRDTGIFPDMNWNWYYLYDIMLGDRVLYLMGKKRFDDKTIIGTYGRENVYCIKKQQANKKMIRRHVKTA